MFMDESRGYAYWYNPETGGTTWEEPHEEYVKHVSTRGYVQRSPTPSPSPAGLLSPRPSIRSPGWGAQALPRGKPSALVTTDSPRRRKRGRRRSAARHSSVEIRKGFLRLRLPAGGRSRENRGVRTSCASGRSHKQQPPAAREARLASEVRIAEPAVLECSSGAEGPAPCSEALLRVQPPAALAHRPGALVQNLGVELRRDRPSFFDGTCCPLNEGIAFLWPASAVRATSNTSHAGKGVPARGCRIELKGETEDGLAADGTAFDAARVRAEVMQQVAAGFRRARALRSMRISVPKRTASDCEQQSPKQPECKSSADPARGSAAREAAGSLSSATLLTGDPADSSSSGSEGSCTFHSPRRFLDFDPVGHALWTVDEEVSARIKRRAPKKRRRSAHTRAQGRLNKAAAGAAALQFAKHDPRGGSASSRARPRRARPGVRSRPKAEGAKKNLAAWRPSGKELHARSGPDRKSVV